MNREDDPLKQTPAAEIERLQADAVKWQELASQGIQIEHELRVEVERLQAEIEARKVAVEKVYLEQAAEIARLQEQLASLQASSGYEASIAQAEIERLRAEVERLQRENDALRKSIHQGGMNAAALAENERLRAALQQIVERYETAEDGWPAEDMRTIARVALEPKA